MNPEKLTRERTKKMRGAALISKKAKKTNNNHDPRLK
jgi:hypothetical protein